MPTPSSGTICWSQIQAETGTGYCMSDFYSVSGGLGYCASNYYNYPPPPPTCYLYDVYDYGYADQNVKFHIHVTLDILVTWLNKVLRKPCPFLFSQIKNKFIIFMFR